MSVKVCLCLYICISVFLSICLSVSVSGCLYIGLFSFNSLSLSLSVSFTPFTWNKYYLDLDLYTGCSLFNATKRITLLSVVQSMFPDALKIARVIPLFKSGDKHVFTNYRPVSLLPQFSKILEKLFNNRLDSFIEKNCILSECQYGFRNSRSTYMALMDLIENICESIDKKKYVMGIFIDLKKAFDTIDHNILLNKLYHYGIRGISNDWIESYLENRKQFVQYDDAISVCKEILCGVPQGSILGPKLFILYINDICNISEIMKFVLFADDTNILCKHENYVSLCELVNVELSKLSKWFSINKLSLNVKKTSYMVFGNRHVNNNTHVTKFLGVYIDYRLDWKRHIDHIINKVSKSISIIYRASQKLNETALLMLYNTLILPYLSYCSEVWGRSYITNLNPLFVKQKKFVRIIGRLSKHDHTTPLFLKSKILKLFDLFE